MLKRMEEIFFGVSLVLGILMLAARPSWLVWSDLWNLRVFLGPALIVYALTTRLHVLPAIHNKLPRFLQTCWGLRRSPVIDLILAVFSSFLGCSIAVYLTRVGLIAESYYWNLLGATIGCLVGLEVITMLVTPKTAVVVVNCSGTSEEKDVAKRYDKKPKFPLVWPYVLAARVGGSVVWHLVGEEGSDCEVEIKLLGEKFRPFGSNKYEWRTKAPGSIAVGPVVVNGCGYYRVTCFKDGQVYEADPAGDFPKGGKRG